MAAVTSGRLTSGKCFAINVPEILDILIVISQLVLGWVLEFSKKLQHDKLSWIEHKIKAQENQNFCHKQRKKILLKRLKKFNEFLKQSSTSFK